MSEQIADAIRHGTINYTKTGEENIVDALFSIAWAIQDVAKALERLGTNGADTSMGAIELLARELRESAQLIAESRES